LYFDVITTELKIKGERANAFQLKPNSNNAFQLRVIVYSCQLQVSVLLLYATLKY